jgi:hypothetical protein
VQCRHRIQGGVTPASVENQQCSQDTPLALERKEDQARPARAAGDRGSGVSVGRLADCLWNKIHTLALFDRDGGFSGMSKEFRRSAPARGEHAAQPTKEDPLRKLRDMQRDKSLDRLEEAEHSWAILDDGDPAKLRN